MPVNEVSLSARGGEENETNNHEPPMRTPRTRLRLVSTCAQTKTKSARQRLDQKSVRAPPPAPRGLSPARSTEPRSAQPAYALSLSNAGRRARMLTLMPAGAQPSDHLGCRVSRLHSNPSSNGTSLGRRCGHRAAFTGYRTPSPAALSLRARATKHPSSSEAGSAFQRRGSSNAPRARPSAPQRQKYAASRTTVGSAADAAMTTARASHSPKAAPWRIRGSLCRCSSGPCGSHSADQHSSPYGHLVRARPARTPAASATPPPQHPRT